MNNPKKLATHTKVATQGTQDGKNKTKTKTTTQYVLDSTMYKQT